VSDGQLESESKIWWSTKRERKSEGEGQKEVDRYRDRLLVTQC